jgi:hypothetical protein
MLSGARSDQLAANRSRHRTALAIDEQFEEAGRRLDNTRRSVQAHQVTHECCTRASSFLHVPVGEIIGSNLRLPELFGN